MKIVIKLEDAAFFALSLFFFSQLNVSWWWYAIFILAPDIGMIGYAMNKSLGAQLYNLFHHRGLAIIILLTGWGMYNFYLEFTGIILLSHASLDRVFGYGLKYSDDFKHTHLDEL